MELKTFLDKSTSFKNEVTKLAREYKTDGLPEEFYKHAVKSVVEKYSADYTRKSRKLVDPESVAEISAMAAEAAKKHAFLDEAAEGGMGGGAGAPPRMSMEEISRKVDEYFAAHPEELQGEEAKYHEVEEEQPMEAINGDMPEAGMGHGVNVPRAEAY